MDAQATPTQTNEERLAILKKQKDKLMESLNKTFAILEQDVDAYNSMYIHVNNLNQKTLNNGYNYCMYSTSNLIHLKSNYKNKSYNIEVYKQYKIYKNSTLNGCTIDVCTLDMQYVLRLYHDTMDINDVYYNDSKHYRHYLSNINNKIGSINIDEHIYNQIKDKTFDSECLDLLLRNNNL